MIVWIDDEPVWIDGRKIRPPVCPTDHPIYSCHPPDYEPNILQPSREWQEYARRVADEAFLRQIRRM